MSDGYYFQLPRSEAKKIMLRSAVMFTAIFVALAVINGRLFVEGAVLVVFGHLGSYFFLVRHKYAFVSSDGLRGESPLGRSVNVDWGDQISVQKKSVAGVHGFVIKREGFLDSVFIPKAIAGSTQFRSAIAKFAPANHVLLTQRL